MSMREVDDERSAIYIGREELGLVERCGVECQSHQVAIVHVVEIVAIEGDVAEVKVGVEALRLLCPGPDEDVFEPNLRR
ncbi:MAG: hypothetical protein ACOC1F_13150, partial [Myxococcota bacterium]